MDAQSIDARKPTDGQAEMLELAEYEPTPGVQINQESKSTKNNLRSSPQREESVLADASDTLLLKRQRNSDLEPRKKSRNILRRFQGWRMGAILCASATATVLLINIIFVVVIPAVYGAQSGLTTIQEGSCSKSKHLDTWLHLLINILSTVLLSASNYCMQCLCAPTRDDIDKAHAQNQWLDIGVQSTRNLKGIPKPRLMLWLALGAFSVPLHFFYNSAILQTQSVQQYAAFVAYPDLWSDSTVNWSTTVGEFEAFQPIFTDSGADLLFNELPSLEAFRNASTWQRLDNVACIEAYAKPFLTSRTDVLAITSTLNVTTPMQVVSESVAFSSIGHAPGWMCSGYEQANCKLEDLKRDPANWTIYDILTKETPIGSTTSGSYDAYKKKAYPIEYCLSHQVNQRCTLQMSLVIMVFVIICNAVKVLCMVAMLRYQTSVPLVTIGDAIQSFLVDEDKTTMSMCLASKKTIPGWPENRKWDETRTPQVYQGHGELWLRSASRGRWLTCYVASILTIITAIILVRLGVHVIGDAKLEARGPSFWHTGFGSLDSTMMGSWNLRGISGLLQAVLLANIPQILLSVLYLAYNSIYTCMLLAAEWSSYAYHRKALRVTEPEGVQRSTYRLQLPYKYGIPLLIISTLLHWLVSQSIFLARVNSITRDGKIDPENSISTVGYSVIPMVTVIITGSAIILMGPLVGLRRHRQGMPLVGSCSAAISAACHLPEGSNGIEIARMPLVWGSTSGTVQTGEVGHCTFTDKEVARPVDGERYA